MSRRSAENDRANGSWGVTFTYKARDERGEPVSGTISAASQRDALRQLGREGKTVIELKVGAESSVDPEKVRVRQASSQVRREDLIVFANQMSIMLETGVPLSEALNAYVSQAKTGGLRRIMEIVSDRITGGMSFSAAMEQFPRVFPSLMVNLMRASEASGTMGLMLGRISDYMDKERKTVKQIRGALTYPCVMLGVALSVTLFLVTWVLPRFAKIYDSREAALPVMTRYVIGASEFIRTHALELGIGAAALGIAIALARRSRTGRRVIDTLKIRLPVIGPMFTHYYLTRSMRTLGTLLASGVQLLEAVRIVRGLTNNVLWSDFWDEVDRALTTGKTMEEVVKGSRLMPPPVAQMIAAGERTGRLPEVLEKISGATEEDLDNSIRSATQLIEPAMIIFMGVTIGGVALALLLPIFSVANVMSN